MFKKLFITTALFLLISDAFAEVPIVFSRCQSGQDMTKTRTVELTTGGSQTITKTFIGMDNNDRVNEVRYPISEFTRDYVTPCDLIYKDAAGVETVIYDCSSGATPASSCSALDPTVSFDGTKIAFTVVQGSMVKARVKLDNRLWHPDAVAGDSGFEEITNNRLISTGASLKEYTIGSMQTTDIIPYEVGIYDISPSYMPNEKIVFVSNRTGSSLAKHTANIVMNTTASEAGLSLWTVDLDGTNIKHLSTQTQSQEQHPIVLQSGEIAYSSWQTASVLPHQKINSSPGGSGTLHNFFRIWRTYPDGSRPFPLFCQHCTQTGVSSAGLNYNALHFLAQLPNGDLCSANYYRGNRLSIGNGICFEIPPQGAEGQDPLTVANEADAYLPVNHYAIADPAWATVRDDSSLIAPGFPSTVTTHPNYTSRIPWVGGISYPFAIPASEGAIGLVWGVGKCSQIGNAEALKALGVTVDNDDHLTQGGTSIVINNINRVAEEMIALGYGGDIPGCDLGIYKAASIPVNSPEDLIKIADLKGYQEFGARAVVSYIDLYGISEPADLQPIKDPDLEKGSPFGTFGAASITDRETMPRHGVQVYGSTVDLKPIHQHGTEMVANLAEDEFCGLRIIQMHKNDDTNISNHLFGATGESWSILDEIYIKNFSGGTQIMEPGDVFPDTSFLVRIPARVPFTVQSIDCDGHVLTMDPTWQTMQPGELKTCNGCHVDHSVSARRQFSESHAATPGYTPFESGTGTVNFLTGEDGFGGATFTTYNSYGVVVNFDEHIQPIFEARCNSCHGGATPAAGLALDIYPANNNTNGSTYWRLVKDKTQANLIDHGGVAFTYGGSTHLNRPYVSKYIQAFNPRRSLLMWKAANQRLDNWTDSTHPDDLDFGADHPVPGITTEELGLISRWIGTGMQGGSAMSEDRSPPTLHLAATLNDSNEITALIIGTVDLGSGINPATLDVCLITGGICGSNLAGSANMHGITSISLVSPISDVDQIIRASVEDVDGNLRTIDVTAGKLINVGDIIFKDGFDGD